MRKNSPIFLVVILIASLCTAAFAETVPGVVNINTADASQLANLPRVGAKAAQKIVDYRKDHGAFHKTADLMQVKGFGQKRFDKLSAYLTVEGKTTLMAKVASPRKSRKQPANTASK
jgi:competence ComEA-like helix-hairpin-helix protein